MEEEAERQSYGDARVAGKRWEVEKVGRMGRENELQERARGERLDWAESQDQCYCSELTLADCLLGASTCSTVLEVARS